MAERVKAEWSEWTSKRAVHMCGCSHFCVAAGADTCQRAMRVNYQVKLDNTDGFSK